MIVLSQSWRLSRSRISRSAGTDARPYNRPVMIQIHFKQTVQIARLMGSMEIPDPNMQEYRVSADCGHIRGRQRRFQDPTAIGWKVLLPWSTHPVPAIHIVGLGHHIFTVRSRQKQRHPHQILCRAHPAIGNGLSNLILLLPRW